MQQSASQMVAQARARVRKLSPDQVALALIHKSARLIDVREECEIVADGRIVPSHHAPRGMLEFHADPSSPDHQDAFDLTASLIVVCSNGARSALAAHTLQQLGFEDIAHMEGGLAAWIRHGFPVDRARSA